MEHQKPEQVQQPYVLPGKGVKDVRLERRALRGRWNVREDQKQALLERVIKNGLSEEASARDTNQTMRAILAAEQQDFEKDKLEVGETLNVNLKGQVQTEVVETLVRTREEATRLSAVNGSSELPRLNGSH